MRRLFRFALALWGSVVLASVVGMLVNALSAEYRSDALAVLAPYFVWIALFLVVLGGVTLWAWRDSVRHARAARDHQRRQQFALCKPAADLRLDDLDPYDRPQYTYVPRTAVPYEHRSAAALSPSYDEQSLVQALQQGRGFVLLGQPLEGKTRTLYEIVQRLPGYEVVRPFRDRSTPSGDAFALFHRQRVILLLDELNHFAQSGGPDLLEFCAALKASAATWAVAATCQDGAQLGVVHDALGTGLRRFYEDIPLKLSLYPLDVASKTQLARAMPRSLYHPEQAELFPTPGYITMAEPMRAMRQRFEADLTPEHRDTMWGLRLLASAGILPYTHARLRAVLAQIFHRTLHLEDALETLANEDFIRRPGRHDPIQPEPAYLQEAVISYRAGAKPEDDFPPLARVLTDIGDVEGLLSLGYTHLVSLQQLQASLDVYEQVLVLQPEHFQAWHNKGAVLEQLGQHAAALAAFAQALALRPEDHATWYRKGVALERLGQPAAALAAFEQALALRPEHSATWHNKGAVLELLEQPTAALAAYEQALALRPEHSDTWYNKGAVLGQLGRPAAALVAYEQALALRPEDPATWHNKGAVLELLEQPTAALAAFERALSYYDAAVALQHQPSQGTRPWQVEYNLANALMGKGRTLTHLQRWQDAVACYDEGIGCWERLLAAGMTHLTPNFLAGLEKRFALHRQLAAWDEAARDVLQARTYAMPVLHAAAPTTSLQAAWAAFWEPLLALAAHELRQFYDALGDQAIPVQESLGLPPDPRRITCSSLPHPGANPDQAAASNIQYQQALAAWQALPWWKRLTSAKPPRPTGI